MISCTRRSHYLQSFVENYAPLPLILPDLPQAVMQTVHDIKNICAGYLATAKAIELFFNLLHIAELDKHSIYRENFWRKYLEAGFIKQSCLILAPKAAAIACHHLNLENHQFASLQKNRRIDEKHAVLLMRMNHLVIAEWSHIGKCRFWYQSNGHAPILLKRDYKREELIDYADYIQQHYFATKGLWQKDAAAWINAKAKIPPLT